MYACDSRLSSCWHKVSLAPTVKMSKLFTQQVIYFNGKIMWWGRSDNYIYIYIYIYLYMLSFSTGIPAETEIGIWKLKNHIYRTWYFNWRQSKPKCNTISTLYRGGDIHHAKKCVNRFFSFVQIITGRFYPYYTYSIAGTVAHGCTGTGEKTSTIYVHRSHLPTLCYLIEAEWRIYASIA